jgi:EmrB/QacA subfamily drug resistance transporter
MLAKRIVPLIVAVALFMENMDSTVIATSLPAIAADIGTSPLTLKLAVTSYLLSLAVFIPVSGWTADRFGARTVFRGAIAVFMLGSIGCALSTSLSEFVVARIVEGMGGAMMTPVARLILVRSVDRRELINAMVWVTLPALIGPALGGFITTYISWHWIFLINIPIGLAGIALATIFIEDVRAETPDPFDPLGAVLAGLGIGGLAFGGSLLGLNFLPTSVVIALIVVGAGAAYAYVLHARRTPAPVLDLSLLEIPTMRAAVVGGFIYRSGIGAMPFLLPLLLQLGFNLTAFQSGLITLSNVVGAMGMKTVIPIILRRYGFRRVLVVNALISAALVAACATFTPGVSFAWIVGVLIVGGFFRSLEFTSLNTIAYADVDNRRMSRATSLVAVAQQVSISVGVAVGALAVDLTLWARGRDTITAADFQPAYLTIAVIAGCASLVFARMPADAGAELARRSTAPSAGATEATDQRMG